jgi:BRCA1-associated protein
MCSVCAENTNVNLWICLICGNVGCGRYDSMHAYAHYEATSHSYAMDMSTQRVWDYTGDGYVHRLIQSKPDFSTTTQTKLNDGPSSLIDLGTDRHYRHENEAYRTEAEDMVPREKMESMANEYTYLLTSQLEGQRRYFEEQVERAVDKAAQASAKAETAASQAEKAATDLQSSQLSLTDLQATLTRLEKSLEKSEKARSKFEDLSRSLSSQLREEKMLNEGLMKRIRAVEEEVGTVKKEVEEVKGERDELKDLNHDLTMFISSQEKVKELQEQGEEVVEGGVGVLEKKKVKGKGRKK